ncbi:MAG: hypothetical protein M3409_04450, partial [Gemmatimonadota bacterium]|nr:hypothetical protein [Gemmatimonadota bacterium]
MRPMLHRLLPLLLLVVFPGLAAAQRGQPPAPEQHLGFRVGADGQLAEWSQITAYFERLGRASPRVRVDTIGTTVLGKPMIMATITSPANARRLA